MQQVKKVVLAYSGGVDTSVCIPYLKNEYGISEVVTFVAESWTRRGFRTY